MPIRALLAGRSRVEVSVAEAWTALAWARTLDGWDNEPLSFYPIAPPDTSRTAGDKPAGAV